MSVTDTSPAAATRPVIRPLPDADVLSFIYLEARLADEGRYWADSTDRRNTGLMK